MCLYLPPPTPKVNVSCCNEKLQSIHMFHYTVLVVKQTENKRNNKNVNFFIRLHQKKSTALTYCLTCKMISLLKVTYSTTSALFYYHSTPATKSIPNCQMKPWRNTWVLYLQAKTNLPPESNSNKNMTDKRSSWQSASISTASFTQMNKLLLVTFTSHVHVRYLSSIFTLTV